MADHTPTPWKVFRATTGVYIGVGEADGSGILDAGFGVWRGGDEALANAEFAVRAVNAHDRLVEVLQEARLQIDYLHDKLGFDTGTGNAVLAKIDDILAKAAS